MFKALETYFTAHHWLVFDVMECEKWRLDLVHTRVAVLLFICGGAIILGFSFIFRPTVTFIRVSLLQELVNFLIVPLFKFYIWNYFIPVCCSELSYIEWNPSTLVVFVDI